MNREEVIKLAREAYGDWYPNAVPPELERFAALVYEHAWKEAGIAATRTVLDAAVLEEREECADVAEQAGIEGHGTLAAAAMIRARGKE